MVFIPETPRSHSSRQLERIDEEKRLAEKTKRGLKRVEKSIEFHRNQNTNTLKDSEENPALFGQQNTNTNTNTPEKKHELSFLEKYLIYEATIGISEKLMKK